MKARRFWNVPARDFMRRERPLVLSIDAEHREATLRTPAGEMAGLNAHEVRKLIGHLNEAVTELDRLE